MFHMLDNKRTIETVISSLKEKMNRPLVQYFDVSGQVSLPESITLIAIKSTRKLEMWWQNGDSNKKVQTYDILGASGSLGPKLIEGDKQVPEGLYKIERLNPNSRFYLSMKINYPNPFDLKMAKMEGRTAPGSDIFIHGKSVSIGCLAMGDETIEELFYIIGSVGRKSVNVIISPIDFRKGEGHDLPTLTWAKELYREIAQALKNF